MVQLSRKLQAVLVKGKGGLDDLRVLKVLLLTPLKRRYHMLKRLLRFCRGRVLSQMGMGSQKDYEGSRPRIAVENQLSSLPWLEMGFKFGGSNSGSAVAGEECAGG